MTFYFRAHIIFLIDYLKLFKQTKKVEFFGAFQQCHYKNQELKCNINKQ